MKLTKEEREIEELSGYRRLRETEGGILIPTNRPGTVARLLYLAAVPFVAAAGTIGCASAPSAPPAQGIGVPQATHAAAGAGRTNAVGEVGGMQGVRPKLSVRQDLIYRKSEKGLSDAESFTQGTVEFPDGAAGDLESVRAAVQRNRGRYAVGADAKFSGILREVQVYTDHAVGSGESGEGARVYLAGMGPGFLLDVRGERFDGECFFDTGFGVGLTEAQLQGLGLKRAILKGGYTKAGGEERQRLWGVVEKAVEPCDGDLVVGLGANFYEGGTKGNFMVGLNGCPGYFVRLRYVGDTGINLHRGQLIAAVGKPGNGTHARDNFGGFQDNSNGFVEEFWEVNRLQEYRVLPTENDTRGVATVVLDGQESDKGRSARGEVILYPGSLLDAKSGGLRRLFVGGGYGWSKPAGGDRVYTATIGLDFDF